MTLQKKMHSLGTDAEAVQYPQLVGTSVFEEENGALVFCDDSNMPFPPRRMFCVKASRGQVRGQHAHRLDQQFLVAVTGQIKVCTETPEGHLQEFILKDWRTGLYIPPMVWAEQHYLQKENVLAVMCAQQYSETDYVRSYSEYLSLTVNQRAQ